MKEEILITGGTGFLGSRLAYNLVKQNKKVIVLKRRTSNPVRLMELKDSITLYDIDFSSLHSIFQRHSIDRIIHCATNYGRDNEPPVEIIGANLILPLNLLQLAVQFGVREFINTDTVLEKRVNHYALSKKQFLDWMIVFSSQISCVNIRLEHFFGPGDDRAKFVTQLIVSFLNSVECFDLTPGEQKRDFIFIDDVVEAILLLLDKCGEKKNGFEEFEIGSGNTISIREFVEMTHRLCKNTSTQLNFGALPYRDNEVMESQVNINPLLSLGWKPSTPLIEGLKKTIQSEEKNPFT